MKKCTVPLITKVTNLKHASYSRLMLLEIKIPLFFFPIAAKKDKKLFSLQCAEQITTCTERDTRFLAMSDTL